MFRCLIVDKDKKESSLFFPVSEETLSEAYDIIKSKTAGRAKIADLESPLKGMKEELQWTRVTKHLLKEMNFLAQRMERMSDQELEVFCAAVQITKRADLKYLINLSYNADRFSVCPGITNDEELGKYISENPEFALWMSWQGDNVDLSDIGRRFADAHMGCFTGQNYVIRNEQAMAAVYDGKRFPDFNQKVENGEDCIFERRYYYRGEIYALYLPASQKQMRCMEGFLNVTDLDEFGYRHLISRIDGLKKRLPCGLGIQEINTFAAAVQSALAQNPEREKVFLAAMEAEVPSTAEKAVWIAEHLNEYEMANTNEDSISTSLGKVRNQTHPIRSLSGEIHTLRLYSLAEGQCYKKYRYKGKTEYSDFAVPFDALYLTRYQKEIQRALQKYSDFLSERGLADYMDNILLKRKLISMIPQIEEWDHKLWGVLEVKSHGKLSEGELQEVKKAWSGQCSDGFGEGFYQKEIRTREGLLNVDLAYDIWSTEFKTEQELKGGDPERIREMQLGGMQPGES